jgi:hypothetical protein
MARYLVAMNEGGRRGDARVLSRFGMVALHAPGRPSGFYANGWMVGQHRGRRLIHHGGTNEFFKAEALLVPGDGVGMIVLANMSSLPAALLGYADLTDGLRELLVGATPREPRLSMRTLGTLLALAFALQLAWIGWRATRLPTWRRRARAWGGRRRTLDVAAHLVPVPTVTLAIVTGLEAWMGRGVSLRQAFDGIPDLAAMLAVALLADLAHAAWKVVASAKDRRRRTPL